MSARRVLKKLVASPQTEAQRSGFGLDKEEQGSGRMTFYKKMATPHPSPCKPAKRLRGESEEQQNERTTSFKKNSSQAI